MWSGVGCSLTRLLFLDGPDFGVVVGERDHR
jgi:hypothetical protein